jgi:AcrR family transcriptional regulator
MELGTQSATAGTARDRILRAAANLYARNGFRGTSIREVAEAAGVTKPLVLYHFESKEKLFSALLREAVARCRREAEETLASPGSAAERLQGLLRAHVCQAREAPEVAAFAYDVMTMPGMLPLGFEYRSEGHEFFDIYVRLIEEGQQRGEFREADPVVMAAALFGALRLYAAAVLAGDVERIPEGLEDDLFDLLMHGVEARGS